MPRVANDPEMSQITDELKKLLLEINDKMLYAPKGERLPTQKELGVQLAQRLQRRTPFSDHAINNYMKLIKYKSNHKTKQYEQSKCFKIEGYVGEPSLVYLPNKAKADRKKIYEWSKENFPNTFVDTITCDNGIIVIGATDQFAHRYMKRYNEYAKKNKVKLEVPDMEEKEPLP